MRLLKNNLAVVYIKLAKISNDPNYYSKGLSLLKELAEKDIPEAHFNLALFYESKFLNKDFKNAEFHYWRAIELGRESAKDNLFLLYKGYLLDQHENDVGYAAVLDSCKHLLAELDDSNVKSKDVKQNFLNYLSKANLSKHQYCVYKNKEMLAAINSKALGLKDKLDKLFDLDIKSADTINLGVGLLKFGNLLDNDNQVKVTFDDRIHDVLVTLK
jgi:hypothetical protein